MKRAQFPLCALLAASCGLVASCGPDSAQSAAGQKEAAEAALQSACTSDEFERVPLTHCVADPARHAISVVLGPKSGAPYRSLERLANAHSNDAANIAFATNAGMFDEAGKPIGYTVEQGKRLHTLNRADGPGNFHLQPNGVFFGSDGVWKVLTSEAFANTVKVRPRFATQSGPMLVIAGKLHPEIAEDGESRYIRNGVGVDAQGRAHFVISDAPLSFGKLARYFRDALKVENALYLDGNVSALWDPVMGRIDVSPPLGPLIVVEKRAMASAESERP